MSINGCGNERIVEKSCNEMLLSNKKKLTTIIQNNMDESQKHYVK